MISQFFMRLLSCLVLFALPLQAVELTFPKLAEAKRIHGELVNIDFIHRSGQFRAEKGELMDFTMPPYAIMKYRGSESDLRDVPLGAKLDFLLLPDADGKPTRLLTTRDEQAPDPEQQKKFRSFTERRGVAGWIDKTEGRFVTVTLFSGDPKTYRAVYGELLAKDKSATLCVANDELRTWNPGVDGERGAIQEVRQVPNHHFGCSGYQIVIRVPNMLEGFRRGRVVRVFLSGWKLQDQFYGESLMGYGYARLLNQELTENPAKEYSEQFPFRTDYGNAHLPWYQLKPGVKPPPFSEHLVLGELVKADAATRGGQFRVERTGELVPFTLIPSGVVKYLGSEAGLEMIPVGTRCRFHLYQDVRGAFTQASVVSDEVSFFVANTISYRIDSLILGEGKLLVARQLPEVKNYNGDMERPPDIARAELRVSAETRVWKGTQQLKLAELAIGDVLLVNLTSEQPGKPSRCTDIWVGAETHKLLVEKYGKASKGAKR